MQGSGVLFLAAAALFLSASDPVRIGMGMGVFGLGVAVFWVAANTAVGAHAPAGRLGRTMAEFSVIVGVGFAMGLLVSALVDLIGFRPIFAVLLVPAVLLLVMAPRGGRPEAAEAATVPWPPLLVWGTAFLVGVSFASMDAFIPFHLRVLGLGALSIVMVLVTREAVGLVTRVSLVRLSHRLPTRTLVVGGFGSLAAGFTIMGLSTARPWFVLGGALLGVGISLVIPASLTMATHISQAGGTGRAMGLHGTLVAGGQTLGPVVLGAVADPLGGSHTPFLVTAAVLAVFTLVARWLARDLGTA